MSFLRRQATRASQASTQETKTEALPSRLLEHILTPLLEREDPLTVLDLGDGAAGTVDFFSSLICPTRLIFADSPSLAASLKPTDPEDPPDFLDLVASWRSHLQMPDDTQLDLILLWDCLHLFEATAIEALSSALQPHITSATQGYGFGSLYSDQGLAASRYAIDSADSLAVRNPKEAAKLPFAHSQQTLTENFICLRIARGTLLREGHLELLLEA